jgi:prepilin-type N-terminal cleavage/methylation domain-containing protein
MRIEIATPTGRRHSAGFTLVEVLMASGVVLVLFVSLYLGISMGFAITRSARENLRATQVMLERMEGIRLFNWEQLVNTNMNPPTFTTYFAPSSLEKGIVYSGRVTVTTNVILNPPASYSTDMRMVTVEVRWTSGNVVRTRDMSTFVSKNGVQNYVFSN